MKNFGKLFIGSLILTATALVFVFLKYYLVAAILCVPAFFLNVGEVKSHASPYQLVNFRVITLLLGFCVDMIYGGSTFYFTAGMFMLSFTGVLRLELLNVLRFTKGTWIEALGLIGTYGFYLWGNLQHPDDWKGWAIPILPMLMMTYIGVGILREKNKFGTARPKSSKETELGKNAPPFTLQDAGGNKVSLADYEGKHHVLLVFVRGDWCPTCHIMIRMYEKHRDKFMEKNIVAIGISPDSEDVNRDAISRLGWKNVLLSDPGQEIASKFGLLFIGNNAETKFEQGVALPASFLVDKNGILRYMSRSDNAGEFLSPALIFPVIDQLS